MDQLTLKHLFIFNPTLKSPKKKPSDDEAQDAKLLYYYFDLYIDPLRSLFIEFIF